MKIQRRIYQKIQGKICLFLALCAISLGSMAQGTNREEYFAHTVQRGQTLSSISAMYHVAIADIVAMNPGSDKQIRAGETLRIPQLKSTTNNEERGLHFHTIKAGETLYRITQLYNVDATTICRANPGLSAENFRAGQVIIIPPGTGGDEEQPKAPVATQPQETKSPCREMHKVKRKETIYSISREYGITEQELRDANPELKSSDKLKRGTFLCIPYKKEEVPTIHISSKKQEEKTPTNEELFNKSQKSPEKLKSIQAALILPFGLDGSASNTQPQLVEYYEGLLLAIDSLKQEGANIDLYVYDAPDASASLDNLLSKPELSRMDLIIGPRHNNHIKQVADFAKKHNIRLVIPFTSKDSEVFSNPYIFQINTPQAYLYAEVYRLFADYFANYNILFIETGDGQEKTDFIKGMKTELDTRGISHATIPMPDVPEKVTAHLHTEKPNIIIPTSGSNVALIKLLPILQLVVRAEENPYQLHLFGYPEWQKYYNDHLQAFYELDTYFYSSFYTNNLLPTAKNFHNKFRYWYNKEMINTYPRYGMLGFDTGYYFLKALHRYGNRMEEYLDKEISTPVQTGFHFERVNNWGGFINKKVFFIHMTRQHELIKLDFKQ